MYRRIKTVLGIVIGICAIFLTAYISINIATGKVRFDAAEGETDWSVTEGLEQNQDEMETDVSNEDDSEGQNAAQATSTPKKATLVKPYNEDDYNRLKEEFKGKTILFVGDSITESFRIEEYFCFAQVHKAAKDGLTTVDLADIFKDVIIDRSGDYYQVFEEGELMDDENFKNEGDPDIVFLLIGVNDLIQTGSFGSNEDIADRVLELAKRMRDNWPNTYIFVQSIYPTHNSIGDKFENSPGEGLAPDIMEINRFVEQKMRKGKDDSFKNMEFVNFWTENALLENAGDTQIKEAYCLEGLHISLEGYNKIARIMMTLMRKHI